VLTGIMVLTAWFVISHRKLRQARARDLAHLNGLCLHPAAEAALPIP
jgi:hypothetical protein